MRTVIGEIAQERISRAERKKAQLDALHSAARRKNAIDNFVCGAVSTDGQESAVSLIVSLARELRRVARTGRSNHVNAQPARSQAGQFASGKLRGAPAACRGIDDGNKFFVHKVSDVEILPCFAGNTLSLHGQDCLFAIELPQPFRQGYTNDFQ